MFTARQMSALYVVLFNWKLGFNSVYMATIISLKNPHSSLRVQALFVTEDQIVP